MNGIEVSLNSQIQMYKRLHQEGEARNEARIKDIQNNFKEELRVLIEEKEEEAKYAQSEKELLEGRIEELESIINELKNRLKNKGDDFDNMKA